MDRQGVYGVMVFLLIHPGMGSDGVRLAHRMLVRSLGVQGIKLL